MNNKSLQFILKCIDYEEFGKLYALNKKISDEDMDRVKPYFKHYTPKDFTDIMNIEGNPHGWMCQEKDVESVEEILGITQTLAKQESERKVRRRELSKKREIKDNAMNQIEELFSKGQRPSKFLKKLLKKADIVYDPGDAYYTESKYGEGQLFLVDKKYIWYIINNSAKEDDYTLNNIKTESHGAVGFRLSYSSKLHDLIKIVSEENIYKGA